MPVPLPPDEKPREDSPRRAHEKAVARLRESYRAIPASEPVRLAKPTSNLFRPRDPRRGAGLDVSGFDRVLSVDPAARVAEVQGMVTYEDLVDATLPHGVVPPVVLDFRTITVGGSVAGLGAESSSFRAGLPHDPVLELEVLTGDGRVVTASRDNEHAALFHGFPHSFGSLGYALRVRLRLDPARPYVRLRHLRLGSAAEWTEVMSRVAAEGAFESTPVDYLDGVAFSPSELYLTLGTLADVAPRVSDYTRSRAYYRSIRERPEDFLTLRDYLWRWDTDMFWAARYFGLERPLIRRAWPRRLRRSDVYRRLLFFDRRLGLTDRANRLRGRRFEWVIQDADVPAEAVPDFLEFFDREIGIRPVWLCPMLTRTPMTIYPMDPGRLYVSAGFWWKVELRPGQEPGHHDRLIERRITELGGLKPLYSTAYYSEEEFWRLYNGEGFRELKAAYDPGGRLPSTFDKTVRGR
ncbi:FAD-binding oxidoreductase [Bailinhaonella thermotolerans]|uniref:Delta(24)-sterol reductase n=1 Tax=Bailinhaonella thermotolerans TaxID=1070861 RepID=A0A3A4AWN4_9ACTN|nr:FAD-binding oxidoreductase [Bailinhaonella thermotolerans]RJL31784.1 FAD-binding oxidoreductase [Bailinhaonella thermotolerans]